MIRPIRRRHASSRDTWQEGLKLDGMPAIFGATSMGIVLIIGLWMLLARPTLRMNELIPQDVTLAADAYFPAGEAGRHAIIIPTTHQGKMFHLRNFALEAAKRNDVLPSLLRGNTITLYLDSTSFHQFQDPAKNAAIPATIIRHGDHWIISAEDYNKAQHQNSQAGWWFIALSLVFVPYFFIRNPRIHPAWVLIAALVIGAVLLIF